jgi:hypothetical protein
MAYQIIKHRIVKPVEYAVHFKCSCGCEFWADQNSVKEYRIRGGLSISKLVHYETRCPECIGIAYSAEVAVPKSDVFTE